MNQNKNLWMHLIFGICLAGCGAEESPAKSTSSANHQDATIVQSETLENISSVSGEILTSFENDPEIEEGSVAFYTKKTDDSKDKKSLIYLNKIVSLSALKAKIKKVDDKNRTLRLQEILCLFEFEVLSKIKKDASFIEKINSYIPSLASSSQATDKKIDSSLINILNAWVESLKTGLEKNFYILFQGLEKIANLEDTNKILDSSGLKTMNPKLKVLLTELKTLSFSNFVRLLAILKYIKSKVTNEDWSKNIGFDYEKDFLKTEQSTKTESEIDAM